MQLIREVIQTEQVWTQAHLQLDIEAIDHLMADDYHKIDSSGQVLNRDEALASYCSQERFWESANSDELQVQIYGETAVVIGRWQARGTNNGQQFDYTSRSMSIYVKRDGRWQMVAEQSTDVIPNDA
jgi:ketosteroid isomerase-like protein